MPSIHLVTVTVLPAVGHLEVGLRERVVPDARPVHELLVRQVHQVVDHELVAAVDPDRLAVPRPLRVVVPVHVRHQIRVGERRVARPHPHVPVALHHRVRVDRRAGVDRLLRRHERRAAVGVVADAVVAAHDLVVAAQLAHRQRREAVPARVGQRDRAAGRGAVEDDGPAGDRLRQQVAPHLVVPRRGVPGVEREVADRGVGGGLGRLRHDGSPRAARCPSIGGGGRCGQRGQVGTGASEPAGTSRTIRYRKKEAIMIPAAT